MKTKTLPNPLILTFFLLLMTDVLSLKAQTRLEDYVQEGLQNNLVLQQKNISLEQAQTALAIARSNFLPSVNLLGDYTSGKGGRSISIPIGDLLNPVYASLNQLTQSDAFPQVENVKQNFFPHNFYDARVRTSMPIVNTDIMMNRVIRSQQVLLQQQDLDAYKRQLVLDIKSAYYNYRSATEAVKIYESALQLVKKNVEINESLLKNGKSLPANYLRSKSEAEKVLADLTSAQNNVSNARKYFNFLLNRDLDTSINDDIALTETASQRYDSSSYTQREELMMLQTQREIAYSTLKMSRLSRAPKLSAYLDLGAQASDWKYNSDARYHLVGVQFSMPIFQGFRTQYNIHNSKLDVRKAELGLSHTSRQLRLSSEIAKNNLETSFRNLEAAREQTKAAQSYFHLVEKGYTQGVNSLIEFLDARNQLTTSQLSENVKLYEMLTSAAALERETASYAIR